MLPCCDSGFNGGAVAALYVSPTSARLSDSAAAEQRVLRRRSSLSTLSVCAGPAAQPPPHPACTHSHTHAPVDPARTAGKVQQELLLGRQPVAAAAHHKAHVPPTGPRPARFASIELTHGGLGRFGRRGPKRAQHASCTHHPMTLAQHCTPKLVLPGLPPHDACLLLPTPPPPAVLLRFAALITRIGGWQHALRRPCFGWPLAAATLNSPNGRSVDGGTGAVLERCWSGAAAVSSRADCA